MPKEASKKQPRRASAPEPDEEAPPDAQIAATGLLLRALRIGQEKDDVEWPHNSVVRPRTCSPAAE